VSFKAVFFDLGGVLVRTEYQAPRQHLAERLNMEYEDLVKLVFDSPTGHKASLGQISAKEHWLTVLRRMRKPESELDAVHEEFFGGDIVDRDLIEYIRSLRPRYKTGLISNAWDDLREYITRQKFADAFDHMVISAEVGLAKPDARIYHLALEKLGVQPEEAVFVDDFSENIDAARAVGMAAIHFRDPQKARAKLERLLLED
jgi:epoxide hydrolase-like predicted phosphatase